MQTQCISLETLRSFCPAEVRAFESHPRFPGWGRIFDYLDDEDEFDLFFFDYDDELREKDDWQPVHKEFYGLWESLYDAFETATNGARLGMKHFDVSRCDDNDCIPSNEGGCIFTVDGTHEMKLTPAGEILEGKLEQVLLTQY